MKPINPRSPWYQKAHSGCIFGMVSKGMLKVGDSRLRRAELGSAALAADGLPAAKLLASILLAKTTETYHAHAPCLSHIIYVALLTLALCVALLLAAPYSFGGVEVPTASALTKHAIAF